LDRGNEIDEIANINERNTVTRPSKQPVPQGHALAAAAWTPLPEMSVTDPLAADVLWRPAKRMHLRPFLGREAGLSEAAMLLKLKKTTMNYWIDRLLDVGLIRTVRVDRLGRNRVPVYRCVADRLRVSMENAPFESYESVCEEFSAGFRNATQRSLAHAVARQAKYLELVCSQGDANGPLTTLLPREGATVEDDFVYFWGRIWLSAAQQQEFLGELHALWNKYELLSDRRGSNGPALMHLMLVPEHD
jgi:DNA-binding MarR family transcriptional regulator